MKANFEAMSPVHHALDKYVGLYRSKDKEGYAQMFELFERWMNSDVHMAGQILKELTGNVSCQNLNMKNKMQIGQRTVDLRNVTCPVLNVLGEHDDVVRPKSSLPHRPSLPH